MRYVRGQNIYNVGVDGTTSVANRHVIWLCLW